jgi:amino acid permease
VFKYFVSVISMLGAITWYVVVLSLFLFLSFELASLLNSLLTFRFLLLNRMTILVSHMRFMAALKANGISRDTLPYKAPFQPYGAYVAFGLTLLVATFKG